jgi:long-chain acyl-CoA synthetase
VNVERLVAAPIQPAPAAVFARLPEWRDRPRFLLPRGDEPAAVTWGEYGDAIRACAAFLAETCLAPGERAAVLAANSVEWAIAALAIQAVGGVLVPIVPSSTAEQIAHVVAHSDARVLFVGVGPAARWREVRALCPAVREVIALDPGAPGRPWREVLERGAGLDRAAPGWLEESLAAVDLDQPALMLYTSGTSGPPKGVPLSHGNVGTNARDWLRALGDLLPDEGTGRDLLWLPMSHIFGLGELCLGNTLGFTSTLAAPADVLELLPRVRPDVFMSVPAYWDKLAAAAAAAPDRESRRRALLAATGGQLRFCLSGGAGLDARVKELFKDAGILIVEGYGLTECAPTLTLNRPAAFRFDAVGLPLDSVELRLADDGEILARGPNVFAGYHKDPEASAAAFTEDGWFKTGDVGRFTEDGFLQIVDRKKDILVTSGGKNIAPLNIELRFAGDPLFRHVVVYGDQHRYLVAAVWIDRAAAAAELGGDVRPDALRALVQRRVDAVNGQLASFETIKRFCLLEQPLTVEAGLLTASLKVRRKAVYQRFHAELEGLYA